MFNFEEEVAKFSPSLDIDRSEEAVISGKKAMDITDILETLTASSRKDKTK